MRERRALVHSLLDVAADAPSDSIRLGAMRRLEALQVDERRAFLKGLDTSIVLAAVRDTGPALRAAVYARLRHVLPPIDVPEMHEYHASATTIAASLTRFAANVAIFGIPKFAIVPSNRLADELGMRLLSMSLGGLHGVVHELGRAQAAVLCRDLGVDLAGMLAHRLGDERPLVAKTVARLRALLPTPAPAGVDDRRRLAAAGTRRGSSLVRALGERIVGDMLAMAEPAVGVAIARRVAIELDPSAAADVVWLDIAAAILEEREVREWS